MNLVDGDRYSAVFKGSPEANVWSDSQTLKVEDISLQQKMVMKMKIKKLKNNPYKAPYVNGTKIELRLHDNNNVGCFTNPLPWPTEESPVKLSSLQVRLNSLETLGNCFTYGLEKAIDKNLEARYIADDDIPYEITKIEIVNYKNINLGWTLRSPTNEWMLAEFDDDF